MAQARGQQQGGRQQPPPVGSKRGQDGSRWYNDRPSSEDVAKWFKTAVPLDADMEHKRYVGGITLIEGWEKTEELRPGQGNGQIFPVKVRNLVFTPYMKVDTRALYFKDWCLQNQYIGEVVPAVEYEGQRPGFFTRSVGGTEFVGCAFQVRVFERYDIKYEDGRIVSGRPVLLPPPASKLVPVLTRVYDNGWKTGPDVYADMKAETGALGRALGMAGMLIVPGSGVATAEDIQEMMQRQATGGPLTAEDQAVAPSLPEVLEAPEEAGEPPVEAVLREQIGLGLDELKAADGKRFEAFQIWAREERGFESLDRLTEAQLRGVERKLTRELAQAKSKDASQDQS